MAARKSAAGAKPVMAVGGAVDLRAAALDPFRSLRSEDVPVPEWGATVVLRALTAGEWLEYGRLAQLHASPAPAEGADAMPSEAPREPVHGLYAFVLACALHDEQRRPVFSVEDVPAITAAFSGVHDRLAAKVFELSGAGVAAGGEEGERDPVAAAGNA